MDELELLHWGIKGMKWGVRRYQNKDGTLTPAGKKRYNAEMERLKNEEKILKNKEATRAKLAKLETKQKEIDERKKAFESESGKKTSKKMPGESGEKRKSVKDMSNEELEARIARLKLEKDYKSYIKDSAASQSRGKRFMDKFLDSTVDKVAENAVADIVAQAVKVGVAKGVNKVLKEEVVYTNNKKK